MYDFETKKDENKIVGSSPIIQKMYKSSIREEEEEEEKKLIFFTWIFYKLSCFRKKERV